MGEAKRKALGVRKEPIALDTLGGRIHVEWDPTAAVTLLGQLPFFIEFLKVSGLFDACVEDCPLTYQSNNAPDKRAVLATFLLSILAGHHRYAHITAIRNDGKRNLERFPADFMFQLSAKEFENWRSQLVMSKPGAQMGLRRAPSRSPNTARSWRPPF